MENKASAGGIARICMFRPAQPMFSSKDEVGISAFASNNSSVPGIAYRLNQTDLRSQIHPGTRTLVEKSSLSTVEVFFIGNRHGLR
jgi:hypothetical protein